MLTKLRYAGVQTEDILNINILIIALYCGTQGDISQSTGLNQSLFPTFKGC